MSEIVYLNGEFMPLDEGAHSGARPRVHLRRRRLRSDPGLFAAPVPAARASRSACSAASTRSASRIRSPTRNGRGSIDEIVARNAGDDQSVYLQVTRGVAKRDHAFPEGREADGIRDERARSRRPRAEQVENGVRCITATDFRWLQVRRQVDVAARQLPAAAGRGRRRRGRSRACSATAS